jgi:hypothetical protein
MCRTRNGKLGTIFWKTLLSGGFFGIFSENLGFALSQKFEMGVFESKANVEIGDTNNW